MVVTNPGSQIQAQMEWEDMGNFRFFLKCISSDETVKLVELVETALSLFEYGFRSDTIRVCVHVSIPSTVQA